MVTIHTIPTQKPTHIVQIVGKISNMLTMHHTECLDLSKQILAQEFNISDRSGQAVFRNFKTICSNPASKNFPSKKGFCVLYLFSHKTTILQRTIINISQNFSTTPSLLPYYNVPPNFPEQVTCPRHHHFLFFHH